MMAYFCWELVWRFAATATSSSAVCLDCLCPRCQRRMNEDVIDMDLMEDLIAGIDETAGPGAILVFLPVSAAAGE